MLEFAKPRCYLAGPMTGLPKHNYPLFIEATEYLRRRNYDIVSPVECINSEEGAISWQECLRKDLGQLLTCNRIYLLPDWTDSKGATLELFLAVLLGMEVYTVKIVLENGNRHFNLWSMHLTPMRALCHMIQAHFPKVAQRVISAVRMEE